MSFLQGKKALIFGVANERSLAWSIAEHLHQAGAELAFTFQGPSLERRVRPLAEKLHSSIILPCDVSQENEVQSVFQKIQSQWGNLDILIHAIAFAEREDLEGRLVETSQKGFETALNISAYSLIRLAQQAEPLMKNHGGTILTLTYQGSTRVIPHYNIMGVAKAALEAAVRYLAYDLGPEKIRVNAISAGPVKTLAAAGIKNFKSMLAASEEKVPLKENISAEDVGSLAAFLCGPGGKHITGATLMVDSGAHIMGTV